jgi:hypothetical protein
MNIFFSICSNNYLAQASVLGRSIKKYHPETAFILFLCDHKILSVDYLRIADEVITLESIEPLFDELALKYNIIELNTCLKPRVFEYLFSERGARCAVYLDPDIKLFHSLSFLFTDFTNKNILLTPHIYTPIPMDGKKPEEQSFLIFGIYNLGFIAINNTAESLKFLAWWKTRTYLHGSMDTYKGFFVDQLPLNYAPLFFRGVYMLEDYGMNMAPWNLHERWLDYRDEKIFVNQHETLKFYHFSSFRVDQPELPQQYYNRYLLENRPDLQTIYHDYKTELLAAGFRRFTGIENAYAGDRKQYLRKVRKQKWIKKFLP